MIAYEKVSCTFQNDIVIILALEYNIIIKTGGALWNLCLQEKQPINGEFLKGV